LRTARRRREGLCARPGMEKCSGKAIGKTHREGKPAKVRSKNRADGRMQKPAMVYPALLRFWCNWVTTFAAVRATREKSVCGAR